MFFGSAAFGIEASQLKRERFGFLFCCYITSGTFDTFVTATGDPYCDNYNNGRPDYFLYIT
jgi:hypothetical protein